MTPVSLSRICRQRSTTDELVTCRGQLLRVCKRSGIRNLPVADRLRFFPQAGCFAETTRSFYTTAATLRSQRSSPIRPPYVLTTPVSTGSFCRSVHSVTTWKRADFRCCQHPWPEPRFPNGIATTMRRMLPQRGMRWMDRKYTVLFDARYPTVNADCCRQTGARPDDLVERLPSRVTAWQDNLYCQSGKNGSGQPTTPRCHRDVR